MAILLSILQNRPGHSAQHAPRPERRIWIPIPSYTTRAHATILLTTILYSKLSDFTISGKKRIKLTLIPRIFINLNNLATPKCIQRISSASTHIIPTAPLSLDYALFLLFPSTYLSIYLSHLLLRYNFSQVDVSLFLYLLYTIKLSSCMHTRILWHT